MLLRHIRFLVILLLPLPLSAQDDLLAQLESLDSTQRTLILATFKSTRVVNGHSIETMKGKHLDFRISHRFGRLNQGVYQLFGLDQATMRMGFEYGINDRLMMGIGRSTSEKVYDLFAKYRLLRQSTGSSAFPLSVTLMAGTAAMTIDRDAPFESKLSYTAHALIGRKFGERLSLQVSPTWIYRNEVYPGDENSVPAVGLGGRFKISRRITFNGEYFHVFRDNSRLPIPCYDSMSWGFDIETGGHVFQLHVSNSLGMIEKQFISETTGKWGKGDIHFGFNLSRTFSFDKSARRNHKTSY